MLHPGPHGSARNGIKYRTLALMSVVTPDPSSSPSIRVASTRVTVLYLYEHFFIIILETDKWQFNTDRAIIQVYSYLPQTAAINPLIKERSLQQYQFHLYEPIFIRVLF